MADGKGCRCGAYGESECGCDADWTPQEVYDLRAENEQLKEAIRRLADQDATLSVQGGNVIIDMTARVLLPGLDPNGAPGWNAAIGAVRQALADAGVDWDTE